MEPEGRKIVKIEHNSKYLKKYLKDHLMTEEGLNKARYRLAYEDGYRQAIKNAVMFLKSYRRDSSDGTGYIAGIIDDQTIEEFKEEMEENYKMSKRLIINREINDDFCSKPKLSELIKRHFEETPQEELDKEWEDIKYLNDIGPDVEEYCKLLMFKDSYSDIDED